VVFDGAAATLTDDAARTLYGIAADAGGRAGTNVAADPPLPVGVLQQPVP